MSYVIGGAAAIFLLALAVGGLTGRVRLNSCCSIADPRRDKRMASAYDDQ
ncbi:MAG: hypothetical protein WCJ42_08670 [Actinomycetes bacterium]